MPLNVRITLVAAVLAFAGGLVSGEPPPGVTVALGDCDRFVASSEAQRQANISGRFIYLCQQALIEKPWRKSVLELAIAQTETRRQAWLTLSWGNASFCTKDSRIDQMEKLRDIIGPERWARGEMPRPIPFWCYEERD